MVCITEMKHFIVGGVKSLPSNLVPIPAAMLLKQYFNIPSI